MLEVRFWTVNITESRSYSKFEFRTSKNHMLALQYRLNVDYRGAVNGLNRTNSQSTPRDSADGHRVQAKRVGAVGRSGGEDPGKRTVGIGTGMNFQYLAVSLMKPGYDDYLVTRVKAVESLSRERMHLNPRVERPQSPASGLSQYFSGWTGLRRWDEAQVFAASIEALLEE